MPYPLDLQILFTKALQVLGPDRILFGTDSSFFPRGWRRDIFDTQLAILQALQVPSAHVTQILSGNIARLVER